MCKFFIFQANQCFETRMYNRFETSENLACYVYRFSPNSTILIVLIVTYLSSEELPKDQREEFQSHF